MTRLLTAIAAITLLAPHAGIGAPSQETPKPPVLTAEAVESAQLAGTGGVTAVRSPAVIRAQVLLDRARFSPGVIDGVMGSNVRKAIRAYQSLRSLPVSGDLNEETWAHLTAADRAPVLTRYRLTESDIKGPYLRRIPEEMRAQSKLKHLGYRSIIEHLGEKFHMEEGLLKLLNPQAAWEKAGSSIVVASVARVKPDGILKSISVDVKGQTVKLFNNEGRVIGFYPATVGSAQFPSPSGDLEVVRWAANPTFTYSSRLSYVKLKKGEVVQIQPGPNNPVGTVWIGLNKPGYGIHGTPEPAKISKRASHGCVRLTNWDARDLVKLVKKGIPVRFHTRTPAAEANGKPQPGDS